MNNFGPNLWMLPQVSFGVALRAKLPICNRLNPFRFLSITECRHWPPITMRYHELSSLCLLWFHAWSSWLVIRCSMLSSQEWVAHTFTFLMLSVRYWPKTKPILYKVSRILTRLLATHLAIFHHRMSVRYWPNKLDAAYPSPWDAASPLLTICDAVFSYPWMLPVRHDQPISTSTSFCHRMLPVRRQDNFRRSNTSETPGHSLPPSNIPLLS